MRPLFLIYIIFLATNTYSQRLSSEDMVEDFDYLVQELKLQHQGLYQYHTEDFVQRQLDSIRISLTDRRKIIEFYKTLRYTIGLTNEGHTSIDLPKLSMMKLGLSKSFLPLTVAHINNDYIIKQNYGKEIEGLKKGQKLLAINGKNIEKILQDLHPLIPSDGYNETSKYEWTGGVNLSLLYRLVYGKEKKFQLTVQGITDEKPINITIPAVRFINIKARNAKFKAINFDFNEFRFAQINDSIAYLSIPDFGADGGYEAYYKWNFRRIDSLNTKHLILDIQANGGGTEGNENLLFSYLTHDPIRKYKKVTMLPKPYDKDKEDPGLLFDQWERKNHFAERGHFTLSSEYYSDLGYIKPAEDLIYDGKVYVLISGKTFSGGAEFASMVKMANRGVFIGEETGGTYEGNVSGYSETIVLPNSKIKVNIPTVHFQINVDPKIRGRGVLPDYVVPQTWEDYLDGENTRKNFIIDLINKDASGLIYL